MRSGGKKSTGGKIVGARLVGTGLAKAKLAMQKPVVLKDNLRLENTLFCGMHKFSSGCEVPIYEVFSIHSFNQLIGHAKFVNSPYGYVYCRGECRLHNNLIPSLFRKAKNVASHSRTINSIVKAIKDDTALIQTLNLKGINEEEKIEGMLQHYGIPTRYIDVVDNHWVSLWMGLHKCEKYSKVNDYVHYNRRDMPIVELATSKVFDEQQLYQYILLIALPYDTKIHDDGVTRSDDYYQIDLRQALPSFFLRPHAQHGLVFRKIPHKASDINDYDASDAVVGILKIRIDRSFEWIGDGMLLSQNNLFPPAGFDHGYDILLSRSDLFKKTSYSIAKYI